jgi:enoyl-CoA hydratase/carnithine racemase
MIIIKKLTKRGQKDLNFKYFSTKSVKKNEKDEIIYETHNSVALLTLNRPKQMNALSKTLIDQMIHHLNKCQLDKTIKAIIVKGNGPSFCSGGDITQIYKNYKLGSKQEALESIHNENLLVYKTATSLKPYISFIDGITMGGGAGFSFFLNLYSNILSSI